MPVIVEVRPIGLTLGPIQMTGYLYLADPIEGSLIFVQVEIAGLVQVQVVSHFGETTEVSVKINAGIVPITYTFDLPTNSFICQAQFDQASVQGDSGWHVLATVPA